MAPPELHLPPGSPVAKPGCASPSATDRIELLHKGVRVSGVVLKRLGMRVQVQHEHGKCWADLSELLAPGAAPPGAAPPGVARSFSAESSFSAAPSTSSASALASPPTSPTTPGAAPMRLTPTLRLPKAKGALALASPRLASPR